MSTQLKEKLENLNLPHQGNIDVLKTRLENSKNSTKSNSSYRYFMCIDFEATCDGDIVERDGKISFRSSRSKGQKFVNEIISFPVSIVDIQNHCVVDEFHTFIKPTLNPTLTNYCKQLTGIEQSDVDQAPEFKDAIKNFEDYFKDNLSSDNTLLVSDSSYDFTGFLKKQCGISKVKYPNWAKHWVNLKTLFVDFYQVKCNEKQMPTLRSMVEMAGLQFSGKLHSGMDDVENMAKLLLRMADDGVKGIQPNQELFLDNGPPFYRACEGKKIEKTADRLTKLITGGAR